jgi:hypothetical protein
VFVGALAARLKPRPFKTKTIPSSMSFSAACLAASFQSISVFFDDLLRIRARNCADCIPAFRSFPAEFSGDFRYS